jgi:hypothetical protein
MPKIASILTHTNAFAPSVDSNTIRGGLRTKIDTAANLAALFDPSAALQSTDNSQDLLKEKATIVYVEDKSDYYILNDASASDVAPDENGSGWIKLLGAIGGGATTDATDSVAGVVELATDAEAQAGTASGTDAALVVTPANLVAFEGSSNLDTLGSVVVAGGGTATFNGMSVSSGIVTVNGIINNNSAGILFQAEGATDDAYATTVKVVDPTAAQNIFLPDASGNVVLTGGVTGDIAIAANYQATIANNAVTVGKMQVIATNSFLGRDTVGTGDVEVLSASAVLGILGVTAGAEPNVATNLSKTTDAASLTVNSSTGTNVTLQNATASLAGIVTAGVQTIGGAKTFNSDVTVSGNLTVAGDVVQQNSTTVVFNDTFLDLNVANSASTYATDSGFRFARKTSAANVLSENAAMTYDADVDLFKFTRHGDSSTGAVGSADNVAALKFPKTDTNVQVDQADGTTTMAAAHEANASSVRSLGAVAKCSITITTDASNVGSNYAPAEAGAVGYPIKHNLATQSVFVVAIQTVNNSGSTMADPQPVDCKYIPEDDNTVRVSVGVTQEQEQYDIIVIG